MPEDRQLERLTADWRALRPHHARGALLLAAASLDLLAVGAALRDDRVEEIRAHLEAGLLAPPSPEQLRALDAAPEAPLSFVIVQPYVVVQRSEEPT